MITEGQRNPGTNGQAGRRSRRLITALERPCHCPQKLVAAGAKKTEASMFRARSRYGGDSTSLRLFEARRCIVCRQSVASPRRDGRATPGATGGKKREKMRKIPRPAVCVVPKGVPLRGRGDNPNISPAAQDIDQYKMAKHFDNQPVLDGGGDDSSSIERKEQPIRQDEALLRWVSTWCAPTSRPNCLELLRSLGDLTKGCSNVERAFPQVSKNVEIGDQAIHSPGQAVAACAPNVCCLNCSLLSRMGPQGQAALKADPVRGRSDQSRGRDGPTVAPSSQGPRYAPKQPNA